MFSFNPLSISFSSEPARIAKEFADSLLSDFFAAFLQEPSNASTTTAVTASRRLFIMTSKTNGAGRSRAGYLGNGFHRRLLALYARFSFGQNALQHSDIAAHRLNTLRSKLIHLVEPREHRIKGGFQRLHPDQR